MLAAAEVHNLWLLLEEYAPAGPASVCLASQMGCEEMQQESEVAGHDV